jgi:hypothetical protein
MEATTMYHFAMPPGAQPRQGIPMVTGRRVTDWSGMYRPAPRPRPIPHSNPSGPSDPNVQFGVHWAICAAAVVFATAVLVYVAATWGSTTDGAGVPALFLWIAGMRGLIDHARWQPRPCDCAICVAHRT